GGGGGGGVGGGPWGRPGGACRRAPPRLGEIAGDRRRLHPVLLREPLREDVERGLRPCREHDVVSIRREALGEIDSDAHRGTGDERRPSVPRSRVGHGCPPIVWNVSFTDSRTAGTPA